MRFSKKFFLVALLLAFVISIAYSVPANAQQYAEKPYTINANIYYYNGTKAVNYALMVHDDYLHKPYYPSGINESVMQKNLDYFNSEDCAHFVSEALIAGGLTALANNPPGDNLTHYMSGFPGSYGIVGVYRLADWLAGYDLPIFPANVTEEETIGYQPIPASYEGSPHASIYYVTNYSMLPSYFLYPGDVVMDGGAGNGHAMLYIGNNDVVQTDPAAIWSYSPTVDQNISFYGMLTLNGVNVSAIYVHIPTFSKREVRITVLHGSSNITGSLNKVISGENLTLISSFPQGVGGGNYSYKWIVNGKLYKTGQVISFTPSRENYNIEVQATGSNGSISNNITLDLSANSTSISPFDFVLPIVVIAIAVFIVFFVFRKRLK